MVYTIEYKRTVRVRPYETVTISLREDFEGISPMYDKDYQGLKAQVNKWIDEALEELGADERD